jgi:hypothetical protein
MYGLRNRVMNGRLRNKIMINNKRMMINYKMERIQ